MDKLLEILAEVGIPYAYDHFAEGGIEALNVADYFLETPLGEGDVDFPKYLEALKKVGCTTLNYEVHKPMLINKQMGLEILNRFPDVPGFRSLYGNYYQIGGINRQDMKIRATSYNMSVVDDWDFLSTSDDSFKNGEVGRYIREKFKERSRFEV